MLAFTTSISIDLHRRQKWLRSSSPLPSFLSTMERVLSQLTLLTLPFGWKGCANIYHTPGMAAISHIRSMGVPYQITISTSLLFPVKTSSNYQLSEMATLSALSILIQSGYFLYFLGLKKSSFTPSLKVKYLVYFSESNK